MSSINVRYKRFQQKFLNGSKRKKIFIVRNTIIRKSSSLLLLFFIGCLVYLWKYRQLKREDQVIKPHFKNNYFAKPTNKGLLISTSQKNAESVNKLNTDYDTGSHLFDEYIRTHEGFREAIPRGVYLAHQKKQIRTYQYTSSSSTTTAADGKNKSPLIQGFPESFYKGLFDSLAEGSILRLNHFVEKLAVDKRATNIVILGGSNSQGMGVGDDTQSRRQFYNESYPRLLETWLNTHFPVQIPSLFSSAHVVHNFGQGGVGSCYFGERLRLLLDPEYVGKVDLVIIETSVNDVRSEELKCYEALVVKLLIGYPDTSLMTTQISPSSPIIRSCFRYKDVVEKNPSTLESSKTSFHDSPLNLKKEYRLSYCEEEEKGQQDSIHTEVTPAYGIRPTQLEWEARYCLRKKVDTFYNLIRISLEPWANLVCNEVQPLHFAKLRTRWDQSNSVRKTWMKEYMDDYLEVKAMFNTAISEVVDKGLDPYVSPWSGMSTLTDDSGYFLFYAADQTHIGRQGHRIMASSIAYIILRTWISLKDQGAQSNIVLPKLPLISSTSTKHSSQFPNNDELFSSTTTTQSITISVLPGSVKGQGKTLLTEMSSSLFWAADYMADAGAANAVQFFSQREGDKSVRSSDSSSTTSLNKHKPLPGAELNIVPLLATNVKFLKYWRLYDDTNKGKVGWIFMPPPPPASSLSTSTRQEAEEEDKGICHTSPSQGMTTTNEVQRYNTYSIYFTFPSQTKHPGVLWEIGIGFLRSYTQMGHFRVSVCDSMKRLTGSKIINGLHDLKVSVYQSEMITTVVEPFDALDIIVEPILSPRESDTSTTANNGEDTSTKPPVTNKVKIYSLFGRIVPPSKEM